MRLDFSRKQKISLSVISALAVAGIGWIVFNRGGQNLSVEYRYMWRKNSSDIQNKIIKEQISELQGNNNYYLSMVEKDQIEHAILLIFDSRTNDEKLARRELKWDSDEILNKLVLLTENDPELKTKESKIFKKQLLEVRKEDLRKIISEYKSNNFPSYGLGKLSLVREVRSFALYTDSLDKDLLSAMSEEDQKFIQGFNEWKLEQQELLNDRLNSLKLESELHVKVCNFKNAPLESYQFNISGFKYKRSSRHPISRDMYANTTTLSSDIIIAPNECSTITWTDKFNHFARYEIDSVHGEWSK